MFNVIICDQHIIDDCCDKFNMLLEPLMNSEYFAFCKWDKTGDSPETILPGLNELVEAKTEWRAFVVADKYIMGTEAINRINPYDYSGFKRSEYKLNTIDSIKKYRIDKTKAYDKSTLNPLALLLNILCETTTRSLTIDEELYELSQSLPEDYFEQLHEKGINADSIEFDLSYNKRIEFINKIFNENMSIETRPSQVICIAERNKIFDEEILSKFWTDRKEMDYSDFADSNLYPDKPRYILFETQYHRGERNKIDYINFLVMLLSYARFGFPLEAARPGRVYRAVYQNNKELISRVFGRYESSLLSTRRYLEKKIHVIESKPKKQLRDSEAEKMYTTDASINVKAKMRTTEDGLKAEHNIGLAQDCPIEEYPYWERQILSIKKQFVKYLREPQRAVKRAVDTDFREVNSLENDSFKDFDEYQIDDVIYRLNDEEKEMLDIDTSNLYNTKEFDSQIDEADKEIKKGIRSRMRRFTAVVSGAFILGVFLLCFIPMFFSNRHSVGSLTVSSIIAATSVGCLAAVGLCCLFLLRRRLVNRFKHFNYVMSGIISSVNQSMQNYSKYLMHLSNVMRAYSVINFIKEGKSAETKRLQIFRRHISDIQKHYNECEKTFGQYIEDPDRKSPAPAFVYDFEEDKRFDYPIPYEIGLSKIKLSASDNIIDTPVSIISEITLVREELYD